MDEQKEAIMNRKFTSIIALVLALAMALAFCACGKDKPAQNASSTAGTSAQTGAAEPTAGKTDAQETTTKDTVSASTLQKTLTPVLNDAIAWGSGSAGCSLNAAASAASLVTWANENNAASVSASTLRAAVAGWLKEQTDDHKAMFKENMASITEDGDGLCTDFESYKGIFDDAGVLEKAETAVQNENCRENWVTLRDAINAANGA